MKMPVGGSPTIVITPRTSPHPRTGCETVRPANLGHHLRALHLRDVADGKEDRRLGQAVKGHVQQPGEVRERPAHPERERDDPHVLDGRVGEHALDVVAPVQHERREQDGDQSERDHQRAGRQRSGVGRHHHLEAQHREQRDVQQQPRQHRGNRRRAFGMRVGQPGVQRREANLGAVAQQQEHEGKVEQCRIERAARLHQHVPGHRVEALADHRARREIDEDRAEQRERDARRCPG